jgi:SOS response regulatory protein OraA/RecX
LKVRSRPGLRPEHVVERAGIPLTSIVQTLVDLALEMPTPQLERAVNEADKRDLIDPEELRAALDRRRGEPGVQALARLLDRRKLRYHRTAAAQARDRLRDQTHTAAGLTQLRFTHYQVKYEAEHVRAVLARTAARLPA